MITEIIILISIGLVGVATYKTVQNKDDVKSLKEDNENLADALFLPSGLESEDYVNHTWIDFGTETIHQSLFSTGLVRSNTRVCERCGLVNRSITEGFVLAKSKGLTNIEGFYLNGIKCLDKGCKK